MVLWFYIKCIIQVEKFQNQHVMYIRGNKELVTKSCKIDASLIQKIENNEIYKIDI